MTRQTRLPAQHVALLYKDFGEKKAALLPFVREGLQRGERCICIADEQLEDDWCLEFQAHGIDVEAERSAGNLLMRRSLSDGLAQEFNSIKMVSAIWGKIQATLSQYSGIRVAIDMTTTVTPNLPADQLCHWEATLDHLITPDLPVWALCMYDRKELSPTQIRSSLRTHPLVVVDQKLSSNFYNEARSILAHEPHLNPSHADGGQVAVMTESLTARGCNYCFCHAPRSSAGHDPAPLDPTPCIFTTWDSLSAKCSMASSSSSVV